MKNCIVSLKSTKFVSRKVASDPREGVTDRQEQIKGFNQSTMDDMKVLLVGAGGLGGEIAQGLLRKGVGTLKISDEDTVELSNLSRQFFYEEDLYQNKATSLAKNLVKEGVSGTLITAYPSVIQKVIEEGTDVSSDIVICAPDNDEARTYISKHFYNTTPVIFTGLDLSANTGYVFIQEPGKACFGCTLPNAVNNEREPCPNSPAVIDIVKIAGGLILFAIDSTVMERKRNWNFRQFFMGGFVPEIVKIVERREGCELCNG